MGLLEKIKGLFSGGSGAARESWIYVQCNRCGEKLRGRVDLFNDPSIQFDDAGNSLGYFCRKRLSGDGSNLCFQVIEVELTFNNQHQITGKEISGGQFISAEEYSA